MASATIAQDRVAVLQRSINEVLLHTGKALKAAHTQEPRDVEAIRSRLSGRMTETLDKYRDAVHDIEREVLDAKAVMLRDLKAVRARMDASKQTDQQAAAIKPDQIKAATTNQPAPPSQSPAPVPVPGASGVKGPQPQQQRLAQPQTPPVQRNGSQQLSANQPAAPVPDMGVAGPQPQVPKPSSPLLNKKTPSAGTPTPAAWPSPHANGTGNAGSKASPANRSSVPAPVPTPKPIPIPATIPPVTSTPVTSTPVTSTPVISTPVTSTPVISTPVTSTPVTSTPVTSTPAIPAPSSSAPASSVPAPAAAPVTAAPVPMMDASQGSEFLNLPPATSGAGTLKFTDMAFTVAQENDSANEGPSQPMSTDLPGSNPEIIDLDSLFDTAAASGGEQSAAPTASMDLDNTSMPSNQAQQSSAALDDMYDLGGGTAESMDLDFALDQSGGGGSSYIDDLLFGTGDGSLGELDESSLG